MITNNLNLFSDPGGIVIMDKAHQANRIFWHKLQIMLSTAHDFASKSFSPAC